ncbi:MAG TPA: metallophosphoesterase [Candidatus Ozemobacteraceae bacterium]|nr:metallophosphoesterase [Candidatus Ozemobacteraceae bacterium]
MRSNLLRLLLVISLFQAGMPSCGSAEERAAADDALQILAEHEIDNDQDRSNDQAVSLNIGASAASGPASVFGGMGTGGSLEKPSVPAVTIALASDLHVDEKNANTNRSLVDAVNDLPGISLVAICGDLCREIGSKEELARVAQLVGRFADPVLAVPGNHDFMYRDHFDKNGKKIRGMPSDKKTKLERFRQVLKLKSLRYSRKAGGHLMVFLPIDELDGKPLAKLSDATLRFFRETLEANPTLPTIVFCHAPLEGSYERETDLGPVNGNVQPASKIRDILSDHPQVFLWVAGHLHIKPSSKDYNSRSNKVDGVTGIHLSDTRNGSPWIRTMRLTPESVLIRTYNTETRKYVAGLDRTFRHKKTETAMNPPADDGKDTGTTTGATDQGKPSETGSDSAKTNGSGGYEAFQKRLDALFEKIEVLMKKVQTLLKQVFK